MRQRIVAAPWVVFSALRRYGRSAALLALLALAACATPPPEDDAEAVEEFKAINDPLEPTNRTLYDVNNAIDQVLLGPLGYGYRWAVPKPVRDSIRDALDNAASPVVLANHLLQGKPCRAGDTLVRLVVNTTLGLGGFIDVARKMGIPQQKTDFGLTLGTWGVPGGPYLFLPVLGSSSPTDLAGNAVDLAADPLSWIVSGKMIDDVDWARLGMYATDSAERWLDQVQEINRTSLDPYVTYRSFYRQFRRHAIERARDDDDGVVCG